MSLKRSNRISTRSTLARCIAVITADPFVPQRDGTSASVSTNPVTAAAFPAGEKHHQN
jgi:LDH2 family malate/lactate/ureidoglycolate dehydrogenase